MLSNYKDIHIHCRAFDEKQSKKPKQEIKITHNPLPRNNLCEYFLSLTHPQHVYLYFLKRGLLLAYLVTYFVACCFPLPLVPFSITK